MEQLQDIFIKAFQEPETPTIQIPVEAPGLSLEEYMHTKEVEALLYRYAEQIRGDKENLSPLDMTGIAYYLARLFENKLKKEKISYKYSLEGFALLPKILYEMLTKYYGVTAYNTPGNFYYQKIQQRIEQALKAQPVASSIESITEKTSKLTQITAASTQPNLIAPLEKSTEIALNNNQQVVKVVKKKKRKPLPVS